MSGNRIIEQVKIDDIDLSDETYKISSGKFHSADSSENSLKRLNSNALHALADSIEKIGLINLPILKKVKDRYMIICGFKRVHAMKFINCMLQTSATVILPESAEPSQEEKISCASIAIADNAFQRQLNVMEQLRGVSLLKEYLSIEQIALSSHLIFNSRMNVAMIRMFDELSRMPESVHELIENERLAMTTALKLKECAIEEIDSFADLFLKIRTGLNKQKEIITNIIEIAAREDISIADLISSDDIISITDQDDIDENRKGNLVRSILLQRRYPNLSKAKEQFAENFKKLSMKGDIKFDPPVDFEGRDYTFSFKVSTVEELTQKVEILSRVSHNPLIGQILP